MRELTWSMDEDTDTVLVQFPYHEGLLERIKSAVPPEDRNPDEGTGRGWDPEEKTWGFSSEWLETIIQLVRETWSDLKVMEE